MAIPLIALLTGIILELALGRFLSPLAKGLLALASGLVAGGASLALVPAMVRGETLDGVLLRWDVGISLAYHIDGLSLIFMLMAAGLGSAILLYCLRYMEHEPEGLTRFYVLMLTFIAGMVNLVCSANLLMTYVSWEVIGLCSYFLVGFWYKQAAAANGARQVLVMTHLAGYGLLAAIMLLFVRSGTFNWTDPALRAAFTTGIFLLMLVAAMAKSAMFPLHTWIPEAMNAPTPVSALLHSACYVKAGIYLIARMYSFAPWPPAWNLAVLAIGCVTLTVGAAFALVQTDLKRLLAFSTISQLGYIVTALGIGTPLGVAAGLFYTLSHGLFKGTLFLCAGAVQHATGTRDMRQLGGLAATMPQTARVWLIAAAAIVGVPLTNGFVAKWLLYDAALRAGLLPVVVIAWMVSTFTAFYMLKATVSVFYGELPPALRERPVREAAPSMLTGMGVLAALCLVFGIAPQILMSYCVAPAVRSLGLAWEVSLSWLGLQTSSAGAQVSLGAGFALLAALAGYVLYLAARPAQSEAVGVFTGGDSLALADGTFSVEDFSDLASHALEPVYAAANPDPLYLTLWRGLRGLAGMVDGVLTPWAEGRPILTALAVIVVVAVLTLVWRVTP